ncbi:MAG: hypothetical protein EAZ73_09170 [Oscillatoriales cyanobacterium]|uniref:hypothetical protein n=1 Tax=unclassified Microcoleus TaxID=2642155 RepID=UPI001D619DE1|nr:MULTISPECIES: hypothetical protein [unclassified Microcoleus]TAF00855.1 MAG: hypothetical protein EAZ79_01425 [Oscillatoriales cyanobacterium]MCC3459807.1 hypothetical protein [Microcoleus sp. PH2017_11_PCY_U_A]MCC3478241.1 hypothetical protein [Microcoleus sp. PH2017_12_PCY_D_A]TAF21386.1 MAG: hypothetical protein EAZ73_09170 [Oscillatoriales cyanobacterium]TAF39687.1 MAG: hypothetical protein EAZ69_00175 [Oscillatoriales cyanobacterium]
MTKVLISGSRSIQVLPQEAVESIDRIIAQNFDIIIGDAFGVDNLVQQYLRQRKYQKVVVYYAKYNSFGKPRNTNGYPAVSVNGNYEARDKFMCLIADYGLAIWDGCSRGTKANIDRVKLTRVIKI